MAVNGGMTVFNHNGNDYIINDPNNAPEFDTSAAYSKGELVTYKGVLYRFKENHAAGAWNSSQVETTKVGGELDKIHEITQYREVVKIPFYQDNTNIPAVFSKGKSYYISVDSVINPNVAEFKFVDSNDIQHQTIETPATGIYKVTADEDYVYIRVNGFTGIAWEGPNYLFAEEVSGSFKRITSIKNTDEYQNTAYEFEKGKLYFVNAYKVVDTENAGFSLVDENNTVGHQYMNVSREGLYSFTAMDDYIAIRCARFFGTLWEGVPYIKDKTNESKSTIIWVGSTRTYTTIQAAISAITDNSEDNRYTILVDEGTYDLTGAGINCIPLKPYVKIQGVDKNKCIISFRPSQKDPFKNVFQNTGSGFTSGEAEVCEFTIISENIKGALHLDDPSWQGKVYFHDIIHQDVSSEETFTPDEDYYIKMSASVGSINLATHIGQTIIIENVTTNGYIYSHTLPASSSDDLSRTNGGTFIVRNCICTYLLCSANGDKVRKKCVFEGNKCTFLKIAFNDSTGNEFFAWNVELKNNEADFLSGMYKPYGSTEFYSLWEEFFGKVPFADPNLHRMVQNNTANVIQAKTKVRFTDETKRYIEPATGDAFDAITMETISAGWYGIVQDGGDLGHYWAYLQNHETIS